MQKEKVEAACAAHHQLQQMAAVGGVAMWPEEPSEPWFVSQQQSAGDLLLWRHQHGHLWDNNFLQFGAIPYTTARNVQLELTGVSEDSKS